jgi:GNAT superfamily N-acetyltransferase
MTEFTIDEIQVPSSLDEPGAGDFIEMVNLRNHIEAAILGSDALSWTADGLIPIFSDNPHRIRRHFIVRVDGRMVGRALVGWPTTPDSVEGGIYLEVLDSYRRRGIGSALLEHSEALTDSIERPVLQSELPHTPIAGGDRIPSPTGFGDLPLADPGVRFLLRRGYSLEMVNRISQLDPVASAQTVAERLDAALAVAGADYRLVTWAGAAPEERYEDLARLKSAMDTDAPSAGMESTEDPWDVERIRDWDTRMQATGRLLLTAGAEHVPSGRLVAYTEIGLPRGEAPPATQEDTLVLKTHRGHRLGMLIKAANLRQLHAVSAGTRVVTTFNAEDNRPMLDVNEALGFRAIGYEGSWQKDLR